MVGRMARRVAGSTAAAGSALGAWVGYHVQQGHLNRGGSHFYDRQWSLGPIGNYGGSPDQYFSDLRTSPNGRFPMTRIDGAFNRVGDHVNLRFAFEPANGVIVDEITDRSLTLVTDATHTFQGEAHHSVSERDGYLMYRIQGQGPSEGGEHFVLQMANVAFSQFGWPLLLPFTQTEEAQAHDDSLIASGRA